MRDKNIMFINGFVLLVISLTWMNYAFGQDIVRLELISQKETKVREYNLFESFELYDSKGKTVGAVRYTNSNSVTSLAVSIGDEPEIILSDLKSVVKPATENYLIAYGDKIHSHVNAQCHVKIYDLSGKLIKNLGRVVMAPYQVSFDREGALYVMGMVSADVEADDNVGIIFKYSPKGDLLWSKKLSNIPHALYTNSDYSVLASYVFDPLTLTGKLNLFNNKGNQLADISDVPFPQDVEILGDNIFLVNDNKLYTFSISDHKKKTSTIELAGKPSGFDCLVLSPNADFLAYACINNYDESQTVIQLFDVRQQIALSGEVKIGKSLPFLPGSILKFKDGNTLMLLIGAIEYNYKIVQYNDK